MSTTALISVEDYLRRTEKPNCEYIDGVLYPKPMDCCAWKSSPEDHLGAMLAKCEQYQAWGVPFCWVVDPEKQTAWQYHIGAEPLRLDRAGILYAGELSIVLAELFADLPR